MLYVLKYEYRWENVTKQVYLVRFPSIVTIELELVDRALKRYPVVSYEEVPSSVAKTNGYARRPVRFLNNYVDHFIGAPKYI